jgi:hypothetical protein
MTFRVSYKGITRFCGSLVSAFYFLERHWGSPQLAAEIGVKVEPLKVFA